MDKHNKLQRYSHKDYSEVVDFPVEIVGRDGVVRRYTFEDAVRLYQRRETFAPVRHQDDDLVDAEVAHCRQRVEQLRRSYFIRFGWKTADGDPLPEMVFGDLAGEIAAFLRRLLGCEERPDVRIVPVAGGHHEQARWLVLGPGLAPGLVLRVYRFHPADLDGVRERFFQYIEGDETEVGDEEVVATHHGADCGLLLTAPTGLGLALAPSQAEGARAEFDGNEWDEVLDKLRLERFADALGSLGRVIERRPLERRAYVLGASLAYAMERYVDAATFAHIGSLYFPEDPDLRYWLGMTSWQIGRYDDGIQYLERARRSLPRSSWIRAALARSYWKMARPGAAARASLLGPVNDEERRTLQDCTDLRRSWTRVLAGACLVGAAASGGVLAAVAGQQVVGVGALGVAVGGIIATGISVTSLVSAYRTMPTPELGWWIRRASKGPGLVL